MEEFDQFFWELLLVIFQEKLSIEIGALWEVSKTCPTQRKKIGLVQWAFLYSTQRKVIYFRVYLEKIYRCI